MPLENGSVSDESERMQFDEDGVASDAEGAVESRKQRTKKKLIGSDVESDVTDSDNDDSDAPDQDEDDKDADDTDDDDLLPIEKANKKLKKKQEEERCVSLAIRAE